jgi:hypothetical protein
LAAVLVLHLAVAPASAVTWFDDFNDGDAEDGSPLTWTPYPVLPGDYNATSGDYVLNPGFGASNDDSMAVLIETANNPTIPAFTDVSVRTRGTIIPDPESDLVGGNLVLISRFDFATFSGYISYLDDGGQMWIGTFTGGAESDQIVVYDPDDQVPPVEDFIHAGQEVVIQLDTFGNELSFTAWYPGEPQPAVPNISGTSPSMEGLPSYSSGSTGLAYNEDDDFTAGVFRWAKASSTRLIDGDLDDDGDVDFDDIDDFVLGLNNPVGYEAARGFGPVMRGDTDNDGDQDFDDIGLFVTILTSGSHAASVPEPATCVLLAVGLIGIGVARFVRT